MYSSMYSQVSKNSPQAHKRVKYRSKGKSCGYYMRIVFFFSSLIQSLIIVSLVLFLVYGKQQDSASTARIQDLEESFSRLSIETVTLRQQRKNLTNLLNITLTRKARNDWDLANMRQYTNTSILIIQEFEKRLQQCDNNLIMCNAAARLNCGSPPTVENCNCGLTFERLKARLQFVDSNFTQTTQRKKIELDQIAKERDDINLEAIGLRREKSILEQELEFNKQKCKDEFFQSLSGVSNVSKAFLLKIDSLFPAHIKFQLTCEKQREHLEQIRTNCTSLSREVEDKFQRYLNSVGDQVSDTYSENSRLKAENLRLYEDYRQCTRNRTGLIKEHKQNFEKLQRRYDLEKESLLRKKMELNGEIEVLQNSVKYKTKEVDELTQKISHLNTSCMSKIGTGGFGGGPNSRTNTVSQSGWSSAGGGQLGRAGSGGLGSSLGSTGLGLNKPGSTGTGSSNTLFSSPRSNLNLGSSGLGFNKLGSTGTGSSSTSLFSPGSSLNLGSTGPGLNKHGSSGIGSSSSSVMSPGSSSSLGSTGSGFNKLGSSGTGSSSSSVMSPGSSSGLGSTGSGLNTLGSTGAASSSFGSDSSSSTLSLGGIGANKPAPNARGSSTTGSSSGPSGSSPSLSSGGTVLNKPTASKTGLSSSGLSWLMFGTGNSGQSKTGSGTGKGTTTNSQGNSHGGTTGTSVVGTGRTNGQAGVLAFIAAQHLKDLQQFNRPGPEEKQDISSMLG